MAKLILNPTAHSRRDIPLRGELLSIGRDPTNDVVLSDAMVSRRHAVIERLGQRYILRDCNSSNGSLVNGNLIAERPLRDGDLVAIGAMRLLFRDDPVADGPSGKVLRHPSAQRMICPSCGQPHRAGDAFCRQCGEVVAEVGRGYFPRAMQKLRARRDPARPVLPRLRRPPRGPGGGHPSRGLG